MGIALIAVGCLLVGLALGSLVRPSLNAYRRKLLAANELITRLERSALDNSDVEPYALAQLDLIRDYRQKELE